MADSSALRARLIEEGLDPGAWSNGPGDRYQQHDHDYDKVIVVVEGLIRFDLPDGPITVQLAAGDRFDLPAGTAHSAFVVGGAGVTCLEAHLPAGTLKELAYSGAGSW